MRVVEEGEQSVHVYQDDGFEREVLVDEAKGDQRGFDPCEFFLDKEAGVCGEFDDPADREAVFFPDEVDMARYEVPPGEVHGVEDAGEFKFFREFESVESLRASEDAAGKARLVGGLFVGHKRRPCVQVIKVSFTKYILNNMITF